jgi:hypothetical protein
MSTDYEASAVYGLFVEADLIQTMLDTIPAKTHEEKLYDKRTGAFIKMETVVDEEEHTAFVVDDEEYGDHANGGIDEGLEALAFSLTEVKYICAHPVNDKWGGLVGYVIGFKFDDMSGQKIIDGISTIDKVASKIAAVLNRRIKGRKINPDGQVNMKVSPKAKMYGTLIVC